ncbi:hypothetical protein GYMLUDRAFT_612388 [Collybiopsis luxurians FD-317 M1]|uniref:Uncharacterized protein n=1 Tax=Collybiopsis luxurians FD-317 M1 TaxID=944289 RepID=A0A0D0B949_9AGAR|nr:hypothetical protein GYMLUDRAFT_612388 [Collybiopsis luxurians FD-317 M1]
MHSTRFCIISTKRLYKKNWLKPAGDADSTGVCVCADVSYRCFPYKNPNPILFERSIHCWTSSGSSDASTPSSSQQQFENMDALRERARQLAIEQIYQASGTVKKVTNSESGKETKQVVYHIPWRSSPRSLRVGEISLIIDVDTVPLCQRIVSVMWQERWAKKVASW